MDNCNKMVLTFLLLLDSSPIVEVGVYLPSLGLRALQLAGVSRGCTLSGAYTENELHVLSPVVLFVESAGDEHRAAVQNLKWLATSYRKCMRIVFTRDSVDPQSKTRHSRGVIVIT